MSISYVDPRIFRPRSSVYTSKSLGRTLSISEMQIDHLRNSISRIEHDVVDAIDRAPKAVQTALSTAKLDDACRLLVPLYIDLANELSKRNASNPVGVGTSTAVVREIEIAPNNTSVTQMVAALQPTKAVWDKDSQSVKQVAVDGPTTVVSLHTSTITQEELSQRIAHVLSLLRTITDNADQLSTIAAGMLRHDLDYYAALLPRNVTRQDLKQAEAETQVVVTSNKRQPFTVTDPDTKLSTIDFGKGRHDARVFNKIQEYTGQQVKTLQDLIDGGYTDLDLLAFGAYFSQIENIRIAIFTATGIEDHDSYVNTTDEWFYQIVEIGSYLLKGTRFKSSTTWNEEFLKDYQDYLRGHFSVRRSIISSARDSETITKEHAGNVLRDRLLDRILLKKTREELRTTTTRNSPRNKTVSSISVRA